MTDTRTELTTGAATAPTACRQCRRPATQPQRPTAAHRARPSRRSPAPLMLLALTFEAEPMAMELPIVVVVLATLLNRWRCGRRGVPSVA
jgi:hypothetical protein